MSKILKNNTASPVLVSDTGITVPGSGQYTIPAQDYLLWAQSSNVVTYIGASTFTVNDGSVDLSISDGVDLIKGLFPKRVQVANVAAATINPSTEEKQDTLIAHIPSSLGQKTMANSLAIAMASDQSVPNMADDPAGTDNTLKVSGVIAAQSTTTPLAANATFTGTGFIASNAWDHLVIIAFSDVVSAVNGFKVQWYNDSLGTQSLSNNQYSYNGIGFVHSYVKIPIRGPFFQITYLNGATIQTVFRLHVRLGAGTHPADTLDLFQPHNVTHSAMNVRSYATGRHNEVRNRTAVEAFITNVTIGAGTTIRATTAGKTFYMETLIISAINTANATGSFVLQDGTDVADRIPFLVANNPIGGQSGQMCESLHFGHDPKPFTTDVRAINIAGTNAVSIYVRGYEE